MPTLGGGTRIVAVAIITSLFSSALATTYNWPYNQGGNQFSAPPAYPECPPGTPNLPRPSQSFAGPPPPRTGESGPMPVPPMQLRVPYQGPGSMATKYPPGDPRNCLEENPSLKIMQVVPGIGWDNLRNLELGLVTSFTYTKCKITYDKQYLIPDDTFAIPQKTSRVERQAEIFDHWNSWHSATSSSINVGFDLFGKIGGKFSHEYSSMKARQYRDSSFSMRIQLRHRLYTIKQLPDSQLHPGFKQRLLEIGSLLLTNDTASATFLAEMLIRDYGTHFISSVDAGAVLIQEDDAKHDYKNSFSGSANKVSAGIGLDFTEMLGIPLKIGAGASYASSNSDLSTYRSKRTSSKIVTYGGPPFRVGTNLSRWEDGILDNLVAIDRSGRPVYTLITSQSLQPEMADTILIQDVRKLVKKVTAFYYGYNTHTGCTDPGAKNFDYEANVQAQGSCNAADSNHTFGGVYQTCSSNGPELCGPLQQKNPLTGDFSCPTNHVSVLLMRRNAKRHTSKQVCKSQKRCILWVFKCRYYDKCNSVPFVEYATYNTFWCAPMTNKTRGYLFGGLYSDDFKNPVTKDRSCPKYFTALKFGASAQVCVSLDFELGTPFALKLGGFFSCQSGNPRALAAPGHTPASWPKACPAGFTQHLGMIEGDCQVNFCVKAGVLKQHEDLEIILPPFEDNPLVRQNSTKKLFSMQSGSSGVVPAFSSVVSPLRSFSAGAPGGGSGQRRISMDNNGLPCFIPETPHPLQLVAAMPAGGQSGGGMALCCDFLLLVVAVTMGTLVAGVGV